MGIKCDVNNEKNLLNMRVSLSAARLALSSLLYYPISWIWAAHGTSRDPSQEQTLDIAFTSYSGLKTRRAKPLEPPCMHFVPSPRCLSRMLFVVLRPLTGMFASALLTFTVAALLLIGRNDSTTSVPQLSSSKVDASFTLSASWS